MNPWWPLFGNAVYAPLPCPWVPPPARVDLAMLARVKAGLERLTANVERARTEPEPAEVHPA